MKWTRASEDNLPKDIHVFHVQWKQDNGMIIPAAWTRKQLSEYIKAGKHEYFYLDESPESSVWPSKQEIERLVIDWTNHLIDIGAKFINPPVSMEVEYKQWLQSRTAVKAEPRKWNEELNHWEPYAKAESQPTAGEYYAKDQMLVAFAMGYERKSKELDWSYFKPTAGGVKRNDTIISDSDTIEKLKAMDKILDTYGSVTLTYGITHDSALKCMDEWAKIMQNPVPFFGENPTNPTKSNNAEKDLQGGKKTYKDDNESPESSRHATHEDEWEQERSEFLDKISVLEQEIKAQSQPTAGGDEDPCSDPDIAFALTGNKTKTKQEQDNYYLKLEMTNLALKSEIAKLKSSNPSIKRPTEEAIKNKLREHKKWSTDANESWCYKEGFIEAINWLLSIQPDK